MPQNPISYNSTSPAGALSPTQVDASGNLLVGKGSASKLNITATSVVKVGPGRVTGIVNNAGTAGFTLNDCATVGAAAAANAIMVISTTTVGQYVAIDFPFTTGLVVGTIGASGVLAIAYD